MAVENIAFSSGYITVTRSSGPPTKYGIADVLRALDIPTGLTYFQVQAVTVLANMIVVLIRTLIDRDILDESFLEKGGYDLNDLVVSIEEMGGDYNDPDISVS